MFCCWKKIGFPGIRYAASSSLRNRCSFSIGCSVKISLHPTRPFVPPVSSPEKRSRRCRFGPLREALPYDLDASLLQSARSCGVRAEEEVTVKTVERNGIFLVNTREVKSREAESGERSFTSRAVVNAAGRWSHLNHIVP